MKLFKYIIDNNEEYPEDYSQTEIFHTRKISYEELKKMAQIALNNGASSEYSIAKYLCQNNGFFMIKPIAEISVGRDRRQNCQNNFKNCNDNPCKDCVYKKQIF